MKKTKKFKIYLLAGLILVLLGTFAIALKTGKINFRADTIVVDHSNDYTAEVKDIPAELGGRKELWVWDKRPELGMGMHGISDQKSLDMTKALGIKMVRNTMYWNEMEPETPGQLDTEYLQKWDDIVATAQANNIELEVVVHTWAQQTDVDYAHKEQAYQRFANFMAQMATRYPSIHYWELFNEMDVGWTDLFGLNAGISKIEQGKKYAQMLKIAYPAIKQANPNAIILTGGMDGTNDFPDGIYQGGGKDYFDIFNIHTYGVSIVNSSVPRGERIRQIMNNNGDQSKPLWDTEFGIDAGNIQLAWGYPRGWNVGDESTKDDPPECDWHSYEKNPDGKIKYDGDGFDYAQCTQWKDVIDANNQSKLYQKMLPYQFTDGNGTPCKDSISGNTCPGAILPEGMTINDYGFGITRINTTTLLPRPTYNWLKAAQINSAINSSPTITSDVIVPGTSGLEPKGYEFRYSGNNLIIKNVKINSALPTKISLIESAPPTPPPVETTTYLNLSPLNFSTSWNMVSFPDTSGEVNNDVLGLVTSNGFKIRSYNGSSNSYQKGDITPLVLTPGKGYWLYTDGPNKVSALEYPLTQTSSTNINVTKGWNLLGNPYQSDLPLSNLKVKYKDGSTRSYQDAIDRKEVSGYAWSWEASSKQYNFIAINPNNYKTDAHKQTVINSYRGFWMIVKSDQVSAIILNR